MKKTAAQKTNCKFWCAGLWPFLVFPTLLLLPLLFWQWHTIEDDVAANANAALAEQHPWARIETLHRGRDALLLGTAPSAEVANAAGALAMNADGVRRVDFIGEIDSPPAPATAAQISMAMVDGQFQIEGSVSESAEKRFLLKQIGGLPESAGGKSELRVDPAVAPLANLDGLSALFQLMPLFAENGKLQISGQRLTATKVVRSEQSRDAINRGLQDAWPGELINNVRLEVPVCQKEVSMLLAQTKIQFATDAASIRAESEPLLQTINDALQQCENVRFVISGHTDTTGDSEFNLRLSGARAQAVADYLIANGLSSERLQTISLGDQQPLADNDSVEGRAKNRRIEFRALD